MHQSIHDVIVQQRCGMNEFDDGGEINVRGPFVPKRMGAQQQGNRA